MLSTIFLVAGLYIIFKKEIVISSKKSIKGTKAQIIGLLLIAPALLGYVLQIIPEKPTQINNVPVQTESNPVSESKDNNTEETLGLYQRILSTLPNHNLYCIPNQKSYCTGEGCTSKKDNVFLLFGKSNNSGYFIARCDSKPCDIYDVDVVPSGSFIEFITKEPHGMTFKMSTVDNKYVEVITLGTDSFVTNGTCYLNENEPI